MADVEEKPLDVGDPGQVRSRRKTLAFREREDREALGVLLSTRAGRAWMYRHLEQCHVFNSSFSINPYETAFREGERNVGLRLINDIHESWPNRYGEMVQEVNDVGRADPEPRRNNVTRPGEWRGNNDGDDDGA